MATLQGVQRAQSSWLEEPLHFEPRRTSIGVRTAFISDTHLGTAGCNAELLLDFLKSVDCETLYLVGDIVDGWQLRKGWYWPPRHNRADFRSISSDLAKGRHFSNDASKLEGG